MEVKRKGLDQEMKKMDKDGKKGRRKGLAQGQKLRIGENTEKGDMYYRNIGCKEDIKRRKKGKGNRKEERI